MLSQHGRAREQTAANQVHFIHHWEGTDKKKWYTDSATGESNCLKHHGNCSHAESNTLWNFQNRLRWRQSPIYQEPVFSWDGLKSVLEVLTQGIFDSIYVRYGHYVPTLTDFSHTMCMQSTCESCTEMKWQHVLHLKWHQALLSPIQ